MLFEYKKKPPLRQNSFKSNTKFTETEAQSIPLAHMYDPSLFWIVQTFQ